MNARAMLGRQAAILTIAIWTVASTLLVLPAMLGGGGVSPAITINVATSAVLGVLASAGVYLLAASVQSRSTRSRFAIVFGATLLLGIAVAGIDAYKDVALMAWLEPTAPKRDGLAHAIGAFGYFGQCLTICATLYLVLHGNLQLQNRGRELAEAREAAAQARGPSV